MLRNSSLGIKRLNIGGGGGGRKNEILIMIVLGAIIVCALGLAMWGIFGGPGGGSRGEPRDMHLRCLNEECGHEWVVGPEEYEKFAPEIYEPEGFRMECPKCKEKAGVQMAQCPKCKEYYVSPRMIDPEFITWEEICPNPECGINIREYQKEKTHENARAYF